jgi:hypothetical protein
MVSSTPLSLNLLSKKKDRSLNSGLHACKASALQLDPHLQLILLWLFFEMESHELFSWIGLEPTILF